MTSTAPDQLLPDPAVAPFVAKLWRSRTQDAQSAERQLALLGDAGLVEIRNDTPIVVYRWWEIPNVIIVTQTGGGKTTLLRGIGQQLTATLAQLPTGGAVLLNDGKGAGSFYLLEHLPGVKFANHLDVIVDVVHTTRREVERRLQRVARARREISRDPAHRPRGWWRPLAPVFLVIDDYIGWLLRLDQEQVKQVLADLAVVAFQGREVQVRFILAMQTAHAKTLDVGLTPQIKMNADLRIAVPGAKGISATASGMLFDDRSARDDIPRVPGGGIVAVGAAHAPVVVPDFPDPSDPQRQVAPDEAEELWNLLAA